MTSIKSFFLPLTLLLGSLVALPAQAQDLNTFANLAEKNSPAVVNISTMQRMMTASTFLPEEKSWEYMFKEFTGEDEGGSKEGEMQPTSLGSGFIVTHDGYILTNYHVVRDADQIVVRLSTRDEYIAKLVGYDERSDIALLKIKARNLPVVKIGRSHDLRVGEWVMAIGSPFGFDHSVSVGVVSATGRALPTETYVPFIQTDVAINPGNSGGPLFNSRGEVIGINSQIYSQSGGYMGLSFAIPIDIVMNVYQQLKTKGKVTRGWLGVYIQEVDAKIAKQKGLPRPAGALVNRVTAKSPADKAGIKPGDVIVSFNGMPVVYSSDLPPLVGVTAVGSTVKVRVYRDGKLRTLYVKIEPLADKDKEDKKTDAKTDKNVEGQSADIDIQVSNLSKAQQKKYGVSQGVVITKVGNGAGKAAGLQEGDVIMAINRKPIKNKADYDAAMANMTKGKAILIQIKRDGEVKYISIRLK